MSGAPALTSEERSRAQAALDGELDASNTLAFESELARSPRLRAYFERLTLNRDAFRAAAPREAAPEALRASVLSLVEGPTDKMKSRVNGNWAPLALAASLAVGVLIGAEGVRRSTPSSTEDPRVVALVSGFVRGQVSGQPFDVVSSDRHTVKPWLASRVTLGAVIADLGASGYNLAGGRIDVVQRSPVPTLVYRLREHFITVSELPASTGDPSGASTVDGYHVERWSDSERAYVAVSDLDSADLATFARAFRAALTASTPAKP